MGTNRLEAFSDGVLAVIITIMVLELKLPHGERVEPLVPVFPPPSYVLSFIYLGIYWNNHHHLLHSTECDGRDIVGESASPVLALAVSVHDGLDGRKPFRGPADGGLWRCAAYVRYRVLYWNARLSPAGPDSLLRGSVAIGKASCRRFCTPLP